MHLTTTRLQLQPFTAQDITETYLHWLHDPEVTRFSNQRFREHNQDSCRAYLETFSNSANSFLSVIHRNDRQAIGTMTVYRSMSHGTADIGLMLGNRHYWRQGLGLEAWSAVLHALLQEPGMRKVTGGTARVNLGMAKIMEQSGMTLEAVRERHELIEGNAVDLLYYARFA